MALATFSACILYLACFGFYHTGETRTQFAWLQASQVKRTNLKWGSWLLLALSFYLCSLIQGWARGVPLWVCLLFLCGFGSLFITAMMPTRHIASAKFVGAIGLLSLIALFVAGEN